MKQHLTEKEEEIMRLFWSNGAMTVRNIVELLPGHPLHFNTVSTFVRALEQKGYVGHEPHGQGYRYFAIVSADEYSRMALKSIVSRYFNDSYKGVVSALVKDGALSDDEIRDLLSQINNG